MGRELAIGLTELNRGVYVWGVQYLERKRLRVGHGERDLEAGSREVGTQVYVFRKIRYDKAL